MSSKEKDDARGKRDKEDEDVVAHRYVADEADEDDPEKRRRRESEEAEGEDFGKRRY